jgi:hypothetical protein
VGGGVTLADDAWLTASACQTPRRLAARRVSARRTLFSVAGGRARARAAQGQGQAAAVSSALGPIPREFGPFQEVRTK